MKPEIYVSVDIESDGPCPGLNSMLSFGAAAFDPSIGIGREALVGTHAANLETLPDARPDPDTMLWWSHEPAAWEKCRAHARDPAEAMLAFAAWIEALPGKPIFVGYPLAFDWPFIYYYLHRFAGRNPFARSAIDIGSYVMALLGKSYTQVGKRDWPQHWFDPTAHHTHVAIDDAIGQGLSFVRILNDRNSKVWGAPLKSSECPVCIQPGGPLIDGPHTYGGGCGRRKAK